MNRSGGSARRPPAPPLPKVSAGAAGARQAQLICPAFQQSPQEETALTCTSLRASGALGTFLDSYFVPRKLWAAKEVGAGREEMTGVEGQRKGDFRASTKLVFLALTTTC